MIKDKVAIITGASSGINAKSVNKAYEVISQTRLSH
jgi:NADP-dependent 3-hydroxy acid dehydrogenase YdfG